MNRPIRNTLLGCVLCLIVACSAKAASDNATYTLYRNSIVDEGMRLHVATFDSTEGEPYNRENCQIASGLFQDQPNVRVRYWCEKGVFRK